jgi:hypothetical protein
MGFGFLGDIDRIQLLSGGIVATAGTLKSDPSLVKGVLRALLAAHAFIVDTKNRPKVLTTIMKRLGTNDRTVAEDGLDDLIRRTDSKPYPSLNGLTNIQRFMQLRNPKVAAVNVAELIDDSLIREVDRAGRD